jgi:hypothetical protein
LGPWVYSRTLQGTAASGRSNLCNPITAAAAAGALLLLLLHLLLIGLLLDPFRLGPLQTGVFPERSALLLLLLCGLLRALCFLLGC